MAGPIEVADIKHIDELIGEAVRYPKEIEIRGRISRSLVEEISRVKKEPDWMRRLRLRALEMFEKLPTPRWLIGIESIDLEELAYYVKPKAEQASSWEELPSWIRTYYEKLGLPEAEARFLAGLTAVFDSEAVLNKIKQQLLEKKIILLPMDLAVKKYPDLVKKYFSRVFPIAEHKFAALHYALWSGGAFVYVPKGVRLEQPIEAFFFVGAELEAQFEHTLVVVDEDAYIHFIEGCAAPILKKFSFHDGAVEIYAHRRARIQFTTIQNWSRSMINFNNKRAIAEDYAHVEWVEASIGSRITYTYPSTVLKGKEASSRALLLSLVNGPFIKDTGSKAIHLAPNTKSMVVSKSISAGGGLATFRGLIKINRGASNSYSYMQCDSIILDDESKAYTLPRVEVDEPTAEVGHEASTGRIGEKQLLYLRSRGLSEEEAKSLIVLGFVQEVLKGLPPEQASFVAKTIELEFKGLGAIA